MSLSDTQLRDLLVLAKQAALAAGEIIVKYEGKTIPSRLKDGGDSIASKIVTEVDQLAEQAILKILTPTRQTHDLGLLTEETTDDLSRFSKDYFWCIDPLDGTLSFTENKAGYATAIALVTKSGEAILGVVNDPRNNNLYWAIKGGGAYKNNQPFKVVSENKEVTFIEGPTGAVLQGIATIEQAPCIFYKLPKTQQGGGCFWDYAASSIIQSEAGGRNSDYSFKALNLNSAESIYMNNHGIIFSAGLTRDEVQAQLASIVV